MLLKDVIERDFRSLWIIGTTLIVLGVVLGIADRVGATDKRLKQIEPARRGADGPGPGAWRWCRASPAPARRSRWAASWATSARRATRYAFLLAIPAVMGAGLFELKDIPNGENIYGWGPTIVATVVSFVVGYAAIAWLLRYVTTRSYLPFVLYRVALGLADAGAGSATGVLQRLSRLQPAGLLEEHPQGAGAEHHQHQRERVAPVPASSGMCSKFMP